MKPRKDLSQYRKVDYAIAALKPYFEQGYKVFNLYHSRKTDELTIQLKDGKGGSITVKYKCTYPVYRFPTNQLALQDNIFRSLYFMKNDRLDQVYVPSDTINSIGKYEILTPTKTGRTHPMKEQFNPERTLVYNVLRPEYYVSTALKPEEILTFEETRIGAFDIEIVTESGKFPEPSRAEEPIGLATIFDFRTQTSHVYYLNDRDIDDDLERIVQKLKDSLPEDVFAKLDLKFSLKPFADEKEMIESMIGFMQENYDLVIK